MSEILLQTKLFKPAQRPSLISRTHLIEKLNIGLNGSITLVSAPAGFGKTTLISSWLPQIEQPAAWLSLDASDNEPAEFLRYLVAALEKVTAVDPILVELLQSEKIPAPHLVFTHLLNSLAAQPQSLILVLEDFHVITDSAILDGLAFLLDHAPPGLHLVITSRADPQLPLSRWRARGQLNEIRAVDLRFTRAETAVLLRQMDLTLNEQQTARLEARTEGWAAGLQLVGLSLQNQANLDQFITNFTGSHRYIMDYLTDEVLSHQPPKTELFLLQTSILDRFCAPLCEELQLDNADKIVNVANSNASARQSSIVNLSGQQIIEQLEAANLFLVQLDDDRTWYRYHHLFADLLRDRLRKKLSANQIQTLHRRAARWLANKDLVDEALTHAAACNEWKDVANAIIRLFTPLFYQGHLNQVANWLARLPDAVVREHPRLAFAKAWLLYAALNVTEIQPYLNTAVSYTDDLAHLGQTGIVHARYTIAIGDIPGGIAIAQEIYNQLDETFPAEKGGLLSVISSGHFQSGQMEACVQALETALPYLERGQNWMGLADATASLIRYHMMRGCLQKAYRASKRFMQQYNGRPAMQIGGGLQATAFHALVLFELYAVDELDEAERLAVRALDLTSLSMSDAAFIVWMRLFVALIKQLRGDVAAADIQAEEAAAHLRQLGTHPALAIHYDLLIRYYLLMERNSAVQEWLDRVDALNLSDDHPTMIRNRIRKAQAVWQTTSDNLAALQAAQQQLSEIAARPLPAFTLMKAKAVLALVYDALDEPEAAQEALEAALVLAAPEKWIQMFAYPGERMVALLRQVREKTAVPEFCLAVETALRTMGSSATAVPGMVPGLLDPLTEREMDVLHLLAQGYSNREIGNKLFIAMGTTKRHIANIYSKMAVNNRTEAAVRARELGLLPD